MSINLIKEFIFHLNLFRNIDLLNQGIYQIRSRLYYRKNNKKFFGVPYFYNETKELEDNPKQDENQSKPHNLIPNNIDEKANEYLTKTFLIRYSDEEVELDEFCYFRIEGDNVKQYFIEFELFFSENIQSVNFKAKTKLDKIEFKSVYLTTITLNEEKLHFVDSHLPIMFQDSYSSLLNVNFSCITSDFRLRIEPSNLPFAFEEEAKTKKEASTPNNTKQKDKESANICYLLQFFLGDKKIEEVYNKETSALSNIFIDSLYESYIISLISSYVHLKNRYLQLIDPFLSTDNNKQEVSYFSSIPKLSLFMEEKDKDVVELDGTLSNFYQNRTQLKQLSKRCSISKPDYILQRILTEITFISSQLLQLWHKYIELLRYFACEYSYIMTHTFFKDYFTEIDKYNKRSIVTITENNNLIIPIENNQIKVNQISSLDHRIDLNKTSAKPMIEIPSLYINPELFPVLYEEEYKKVNININKDKDKGLSEEDDMTKASSNNLLNKDKYFDDEFNDSLNLSSDIALRSDIQGLHLIVLVHGFQGNSFDMRLVKYNLSLMNQTLVFLSSQANQDDTECDLMLMGLRLSQEVKNFMKEWNDGVMFKHISFIGHSIGGLIIRACLPHLKEYSAKMHLYCSLSSPHLGYMYSNSTLVDAGMWLLKKIKKCVSLEQLSLSDDKDMLKTCLYKLSEAEGFEWFNHIFLISSHQDYYAPYESTRIQVCDKSQGQDNKGTFYRKMASNILNKLVKNSLKRIDVNFVISEKNIDSFIGRTAHIQFLENQNFMRALFFSHYSIFTNQN